MSAWVCDCDDCLDFELADLDFYEPHVLTITPNPIYL